MFIYSGIPQSSVLRIEQTSGGEKKVKNRGKLFMNWSAKINNNLTVFLNSVTINWLIDYLGD